MIRSSSKPIIYPAANRNKEPIRNILKQLISKCIEWSGQNLKLLEVGSASGQHAEYFARALPQLEIQPSDVDQNLFDSIKAFKMKENIINLLDPIVLDLTWPSDQWNVPKDHYDIVYCSNVCHISPWPCTIGLFEGSQQVLKKNASLTSILVIYGPFAVDGVLTPQSNVDFDRSLRQRNPAWGVRDTRSLIEVANKCSLELREIIDMPANNKILVFKLSCV